LIFEGIKLLQVAILAEGPQDFPFSSSDFFDFSIYIGRGEGNDIHKMVCRPFMNLRQTAIPKIRNPFFPPLCRDQERSSRAMREACGKQSNLKKTCADILRRAPRAIWILRNAPNHLSNQVALRKL